MTGQPIDIDRLGGGGSLQGRLGGVSKPYPRICRPFVDGGYNSGHWQYRLHKGFAKDPQHYVRAFLYLQQDLIELFSYIEPADANGRTYSHRVQQLLMRACVEVEANLAAILSENGYKKNGNLTMVDYRRVNSSHHLSSYEVRIPTWQGSNGTRRPFAEWENSTGTPPWYRVYNKSKHNRHEYFQNSTFDILIDAVCGLVALLSSQFQDEDFSPVAKSLSIGSAYSYDANDGMESAIGNLFRVSYPMDWLPEQCYDFDWFDLVETGSPFSMFDYNNAASR